MSLSADQIHVGTVYRIPAEAEDGSVLDWITVVSLRDGMVLNEETGLYETVAITLQPPYCLALRQSKNPMLPEAEPWDAPRAMIDAALTAALIKIARSLDCSPILPAPSLN